MWKLIIMYFTLFPAVPFVLVCVFHFITPSCSPSLNYTMKYINYLIIFGAKPAVLLKNHIHSKPSLGSLGILSVMREERTADTSQHTPHKILVLFVLLSLKRKKDKTTAQCRLAFCLKRFKIKLLSSSQLIWQCEPIRTFQGLVINFQNRGEGRCQVTLLIALAEGITEIWQCQHPELATISGKNNKIPLFS